MSSLDAARETTVLRNAVALALLRQGGSARAAYALKEVMARQPPPDPADAGLLLTVAEGMGLARAERAHRVDQAKALAPDVLAGAARLGIDAIPWHAPAYPAWLRTIVDPPIVLWSRGSAGALHEPAAAVVGSRQPTPSGLLIARRLAHDLARAGVVVVSGMARGIDGAAHEGALEGGGRTIAVLGSGPDVIYPKEHDTLAARIQSSGSIVSEFPPGTSPWPGNFPLRNRIISGLARAVVVVEAHEKSGSLITARMGLEQGRSVLAVPGSPISGRYGGCHSLIKDGARLVETVEDVLDEMGPGFRRPVQALEPASNSLPINDLEASMAVGESYALDDLCGCTGRSAPDLLAALGALEVAGRVRRAPGGHYVRLDVSVKDSRW